MQLSWGRRDGATTTTINVTTPNFGQTQISATILGTSGTLTPVGSVVFTVDGAVQPAVTLNGSGVATLPSPVANALDGGFTHHCRSLYQQFPRLQHQQRHPYFFRDPGAAHGQHCPEHYLPERAPGASVTDTITVTSIGGYSGTPVFLYRPSAKCNLQFSAGDRYSQRYERSSNNDGHYSDCRQHSKSGARHTSSIPKQQPRAACGCVLGSGIANYGARPQQAKIVLISPTFDHFAELARWGVATKWMWWRGFLRPIDRAQCAHYADRTCDSSGNLNRTDHCG